MELRLFWSPEGLGAFGFGALRASAPRREGRGASHGSLSSAAMIAAEVSPRAVSVKFEPSPLQREGVAAIPVGISLIERE